MEDSRAPPQRPPPPVVGFKFHRSDSAVSEVELLTEVSANRKYTDDTSSDEVKDLNKLTGTSEASVNSKVMSDDVDEMNDVSENILTNDKPLPNAFGQITKMEHAEVRHRRIPSSHSADAELQHIEKVEKHSTLVHSYSDANLKSSDMNSSVDVIKEMQGASASEDRTESLLLSVVKSKWFIGGSSLFFVSILLLPSFVSGFLVGSVFSSSVIWFAIAKLYTGTGTSFEGKDLSRRESPSKSNFPAKLSGHTEAASTGTTFIHKGWLNESKAYDLHFHTVAMTHSIYARLEGQQLRLQRPKHDLPRREVYDEPFPVPTFTQQRFFHLAGAQIRLLPDGLVKKRLWSKKYPIHIKLSEDAPSISKEKELFIFARTSRDKLEWYNRFEAAAINEPRPSRLIDISAVDSSCTSTVLLRNYVNYMSQSVRVKGVTDKPARSACANTNATLRCLNALLARASWDMLNSAHWEQIIHKKLQAKLSSVHMPAYIDQLEVENVSTGDSVPLITNVEEPYLDEKGLWINMEIAYEGGASLTIKTKVAVDKIREDLAAKSTSKDCRRSRRGALNEEEEDSADSDSSAEGQESSSTKDNAELPVPSTVKQAGGRMLKMLGSVARSGLQKASNLSVVQRAMESVGARPIVLSVCLQRLSGVLCVNLPLVPSDRLWYGFRASPTLTLSATPRVGDKTVNFTKVSEFIAHKLEKEFQRALVLPNMDDIIIPLLKD